MSDAEAKPTTKSSQLSRTKAVVYLLLVLFTAAVGWVAFSGQIHPKWRAGFDVSDEFKEKHDFKGAPEEINKFFRIFSLLEPTHNEAIRTVRETWQPGYEARLIEIFPKVFDHRKGKVAELLKEKTGQDFGNDYRKWQQWLWSQGYAPDADFARFKHYFHRREDQRFGVHFNKELPATIRLDEIRWGGVIRDGIPPLKNSPVITADEAEYLEDSNVVFGVVVNGDARCYPKRILAWHEMFKDTIGGQSVCGVY